MPFLSLFFFLFPSALHSTPSLLLSQEYVINKVLSSSPHIRKVRLQKRQAISNLKYRKYQLYDLKLSSGFNNLSRKNPQTSPFEPLKEDNQRFSFGFEKKLAWGFNIKTLYSDFSRDIVNSEFLNRALSPGFNYKKTLSLELNVDLLKNVFGYEENTVFSIIATAEQITEWTYWEETEQLILKALNQYWKTYLLWAAFQQMQKGFQTYSRLVKEVKGKKKYHFLKPGEAPQTFVEYENIKRKVVKTEQEYKDQLKALFLILNSEPIEEKITFFSEKLKAPSPFSSVKVEKLRPFKIMQKKIEEQELNLKLARSGFLPSLQFQTKVGLLSGGALRSDKRDSLLSSQNGFYEWGLSFLYPLFSKSAFKKVEKEKYKLEENKIDFEILKKEMRNQMDSLKNRIQITYDTFQSISVALKYQRQAFSEIKRSFYQGRVDIFELIMVENKLRELEIEKVRALSEHFLVSLQLKALMDQLVESYTDRI